MVNKKAQELSIGTLILIVLGVIVLVLLVLGFSLGWDTLWSKINVFGGTATVGDVVTRCNLHITQDNQYEYCNTFHKIKINGETHYVSCQDSRVETGLSGTLKCGDKQTYINAQCNKLTDAEKSKAKVNQATCGQTTTKTPEQECKEINLDGEVKQSSDTCPTGKSNENILTDTSKKCCYP